MTEQTTTALELEEGALYRNSHGAEIRVLSWLNRNFRKQDPMFKQGLVPATLGEIWIAEDASGSPYGMGRMLVTADGMQSCGYARVTEATAGEQ